MQAQHPPTPPSPGSAHPQAFHAANPDTAQHDAPDLLPVESHAFGPIHTTHQGKRTQVLEQGKRLSSSMLWALQEQYYQQRGASAWDVVPYYPTSNTFIADTYAALIVATLYDCRSQLDPRHPVYILELAAGSGCFTFNLLRALLERLAGMPSLASLRICYVMSDLVENNLEAWLKRPELIPFFEAGMLDLARFNPLDETTITLRLRGITLRPDSSDAHGNPWFLIANYFFDSIQQDLFRFENDVLLEGQVTLTRDLSATSADEAITIEQITMEEGYRPVLGPAYSDPWLNEILETYRQERKDITVLFPVGPLRVLSHLRALARDRLFLLSSDKGFSQFRYLQSQNRHLFAVHGSFSFMVNYEALARAFVMAGGDSLATREQELVLTTFFGMLASPLSQDLELTRYTFRERIERRNDIHDFFVAHRLLREEVSGDADIVDSYVGFIRAASFDPVLFESCAPHIYERRKELSPDSKRRVLEMLPQVQRSIYPMRRHSYRALYWVGRLYYGLGQLERALDALFESLERVDPHDANTLYYIGACFECQGEDREALECYLQAGAHDPECKVTRNSIQRVSERLEAP